MPAILSQLFNLLRDARNRLDYPLRQAFRWRRVGFAIQPRAAEDVFAHLHGEQRQRARALTARLLHAYRLENFASQTTPLNYRENLFYLHMLEQAFEAGDVCLPGFARAADIGPSHWFYVQALAALLRWWRAPEGREAHLQAYEVDAYRVYNDLHSRYDHALGHMRGLAGVEYLPRGFHTQPGHFHLITMLFPFVFPQDHLRWGLPGNLFQPPALLESAWRSLQPGGALIIVNQGEAEHNLQRAMLDEAGIPIRAAFRQDELLFHYPFERYLLVARRDG